MVKRTADELLFVATGSMANGTKRHFSIYKHDEAVFITSRLHGHHLSPSLFGARQDRNPDQERDPLGLQGDRRDRRQAEVGSLDRALGLQPPVHPLREVRFHPGARHRRGARTRSDGSSTSGRPCPARPTRRTTARLRSDAVSRGWRWKRRCSDSPRKREGRPRQGGTDQASFSPRSRDNCCPGPSTWVTCSVPTSASCRCSWLTALAAHSDDASRPSRRSRSRARRPPVYSIT
jgi:hypothetical protein